MNAVDNDTQQYYMDFIDICIRQGEFYVSSLPNFMDLIVYFKDKLINKYMDIIHPKAIIVLYRLYTCANRTAIHYSILIMCINSKVVCSSILTQYTIHNA